MCDEYFCPGSFPPSTGDDRWDEDCPADRGVAESKGGSGCAGAGAGVEAEDDIARGVGGGASDDDVLREAMMRADYVNSLNAFNQLPVRRFGVKGGGGDRG